jgi:hypothetical protein
VIPVEISSGEAYEARMRKLSVTTVLFPLIVLVIIYSVMGWWALA